MCFTNFCVVKLGSKSSLKDAFTFTYVTYLLNVLTMNCLCTYNYTYFLLYLYTILLIVINLLMRVYIFECCL